MRLAGRSPCDYWAREPELAHVCPQVLGVHGLNPSGACLIARRIIPSLPRPMPASNLADLGRYAAATGTNVLCQLHVLPAVLNSFKVLRHVALPCADHESQRLTSPKHGCKPPCMMHGMPKGLSHDVWACTARMEPHPWCDGMHAQARPGCRSASRRGPSRRARTFSSRRWPRCWRPAPRAARPRCCCWGPLWTWSTRWWPPARWTSPLTRCFRRRCAQRSCCFHCAGFAISAMLVCALEGSCCCRLRKCDSMHLDGDSRSPWRAHVKCACGLAADSARACSGAPPRCWSRWGGSRRRRARRCCWSHPAATRTPTRCSRSRRCPAGCPAGCACCPTRPPSG